MKGKKFYIFLIILLLGGVGLKYYVEHKKKDVPKNNMEIVVEGSGNSYRPSYEETSTSTDASEQLVVDYITEGIPEYSGMSYVEIGSKPEFEVTTTSYIKLSELDELGRCGPAEACVSTDTMPQEGETRGEIGSIKPSGFKQAKYDGIVDSEPPYLWNLLMWALTGLNAEERNLVTGTRYMNVEMTYHEIMVCKYIEQTSNHVMYRVSPLFVGDELVCRGLEMEAYSVEDDGEGINYHVFYYNVQPGIYIDYRTGDSHEE